jgi:hypothetical protein
LAKPALRWSERNQEITKNWHAESALQWFWRQFSKRSGQTAAQ